MTLYPLPRSGRAVSPSAVHPGKKVRWPGDGAISKLPFDKSENTAEALGSAATSY